MIPDEFARLRTAARENDRTTVMESIERLDQTSERDRLSSRRFDAMAVLLDQRIDESDGDDASGRYREAITELEQLRVELDRAILAYVYEEAPAGAVVEAVDGIEAAHSERDRAAEELETVAADFSMPPLLIVSGPENVEIRKGTIEYVELHLSNAGGPSAETIAIDCESDVPASVTPSTVEDLDENDTALLEAELSPSTAGEFDVDIAAAGKTSNDRFRLVIDVLPKRDYVDRAHRLAATLETVVSPTEGGRGQRNGLENRVRTLRRRLESISTDLETRRQPSHSIDNRLDAVHNKVLAIERRIESLDSGVERQESIYLLNNILDAIENAIETPL
jgi:hypothetical protein